MAAVTAQDLRFSYRGRTTPALDGVSFSVREGEIFGVLGPNGSGKSTLFRILATLAAPDAGRVTVAGHDPADGSAAVRRRLGVVFQSPSLDPQLTLAENLRCHGRLHGLGGSALDERLTAALERFGLADRADDRVATLSGGLARRLEIAKALLPQPAVLLLDEPATGLDPGARRDLADVLAGLTDDGVTVLLTTHFMEEADRCHRLLLLDAGRIVAEGEPDALKSRLGGDVVVLEGDDPRGLADALREHFPHLDPQVVEGRGNSGGGGGEVRFEHPEAHGLVARVAEALPGRIRRLTVARPSLEDVFLHLTGHRLSEAADAAASPGEEDS